MSPKPSLNPEKRKRYTGKKISPFCINVQKRRLELGLKQENLAQKVGISRSQISKLEGGAFPTNSDRIVALAKALETDLNALFGFTPEE